VALFNGSIDAIIDDFSIKAFAWAFSFTILFIVVSYEFIMMPIPEKPLLQSILFVLISISGLLSVHHFSWIAFMMLLNKEIERQNLWIAPNIYVNFDLYTIVMGICLMIYISYLLYISICSED
jgi:hypothetical protein